MVLAQPTLPWTMRLVLDLLRGTHGSGARYAHATHKYSADTHHVQETGDKVREKGTIVFIAGPDPGLATNTSIHPNLEHNQVQHRRPYQCQRNTIIRLF